MTQLGTAESPKREDRRGSPQEARCKEEDVQCRSRETEEDATVANMTRVIGIRIIWVINVKR